MRLRIRTALITILLLAAPMTAAATTIPPTVAVEDIDTTRLCDAATGSKRLTAHGRTFVLSSTAISGPFIISDARPSSSSHLTGTTVVLKRSSNGTCTGILLAPLGQITEADLREHGVPSNHARILIARYLISAVYDNR
jgi:hypothetical protein